MCCTRIHNKGFLQQVWIMTPLTHAEQHPGGGGRGGCSLFSLAWGRGKQACCRTSWHPASASARPRASPQGVKFYNHKLGAHRNCPTYRDESSVRHLKRRGSVRHRWVRRQPSVLGTVLYYGDGRRAIRADRSRDRCTRMQWRPRRTRLQKQFRISCVQFRWSD